MAVEMVEGRDRELSKRWWLVYLGHSSAFAFGKRNLLEVSFVTVYLLLELTLEA
jgi:hypothetical protein